MRQLIMRAPKPSTRCDLCKSGDVDRRSLFGGDGPDEAAERWMCASCMAVAWLYCDGTLSDWRPKAQDPVSPKPCPECSDDPRGRFICITGSREYPDVIYGKCGTCGKSAPTPNENRQPLSEEELAHMRKMAEEYPFRYWTNTDVLRLIATIDRERGKT